MKLKDRPVHGGKVTIHDYESQKTFVDDGITYREWLIGILAAGWLSANSTLSVDYFTDNVIELADTLIEKIEKTK